MTKDKYMEPINDDDNKSSAEKILIAATDLFARYDFSAVSIKEIAAASGVNSALISYYFGGKKNLYQETLYKQADILLRLQERVLASDASPLEKVLQYVEAIAKMQGSNPYNIHLIYRELLAPEPMFENYVKSRLYKVHQFMANLITQAKESGEISTDIQATHIAFTLEGIILFFFLTQKQVRVLGNFAEGNELNYLKDALESYLNSLK